MSRKSNIRLAGVYRRIETYGACAYCGLRATTKDHFIPVSVVAALTAVLTVDARNKFLLPACAECNSIAGSKLFKTVGQKRRYIKQRIKAKYADILEMPDWHEADLEEMGWSLRIMIEASLRLRETIRSRLLNVPTVNGNLGRAAFGNGSVRALAEKNITLTKQRSREKRGAIRIEDLDLS